LGANEDMMADTKTQTEPSMEEILASIRRIISEDADGPKGAMAMAEPVRTPAQEAPSALMSVERPRSNGISMDDDDGVLHLTTKLNDDGTVMDLDAFVDEPPPSLSEPAPRSGSPVFTLDDDFEAEDEIMVHDDDFNDGMLSAASAAAASQAFAGLTMKDEPRMDAGSRGTSVSGSITLEELVKEALRPVLRDWLDDNLAHIVREVVEAQVERLAQPGRRR
jgi:uncharacterized protein